MNRRSFIGSILAAGTAPAIVRASSLMPLWIPRDPTKYILTLGIGKFSLELLWEEFPLMKPFASQGVDGDITLTI